MVGTFQRQARDPLGTRLSIVNPVPVGWSCRGLIRYSGATRGRCGRHRVEVDRLVYPKLGKYQTTRQIGTRLALLLEPTSLCMSGLWAVLTTEK